MTTKDGEGLWLFVEDHILEEQKTENFCKRGSAVWIVLVEFVMISRFGRRSSCLRSGVLLSKRLESTKEPFAHASTPHSKMDHDLRYKPVNEIPQSLLENTNVIHSPGFSIKGQSKEGRPAYLDFQATTPLDPRALDAMVGFWRLLF
jgi:hypothetical protein